MELHETSLNFCDFTVPIQHALCLYNHPGGGGSGGGVCVRERESEREREGERGRGGIIDRTIVQYIKYLLVKIFIVHVPLVCLNMLAC